MDPAVKVLLDNINGMDRKLDKVSQDQGEIKERLATIEQYQLDQRGICADHKRDLIQHDKRIGDLEVAMGKTNWKRLIATGAVGGVIGYVCSKLNIPVQKILGG